MPSLGKLIRHWNRTAQLSGLPGDLSIADWLATLRYFQFRCAYCGGPYENMDHFIPQRLQGVTGIDNCLPSCYACNDRKAGSHPDDCHWIAKDTLAHIHAYLDPLVASEAFRRQQEAELRRYVKSASAIRKSLEQYCLLRSQQEEGMRRCRYQDMTERLGPDGWLSGVYSLQDVQDLLDEGRRIMSDQEALTVCQEIEGELLRLCAAVAFPAPIHTDPATHSIFWW
jgi:hypothetical protein